VTRPIGDEGADVVEGAATPTQVSVAEFVAGREQQRDVVEVGISYGIIERFSEGLYSSPNKAFEELVSNSYDAGASRVWVQLPADLSTEAATIAVVDDGDSMDLDGLRELWQIGESPKREAEQRGILPKNRRPIGKFGIGKLATYVLANELTFVCSKDGAYLAVTMDYGKVSGSIAEPRKMSLAVAAISAHQAEETLRRVLTDNVVLDALFGASLPPSWTAAILTELKAPARTLQRGRLRWVLSSALPLNPQFSLWVNGDAVEPSKAAGTRVWTFTVGKSDRDIDRDWQWRDKVETRDGRVGVTLPHAGFVTGEAELYEDTLKKGKSEETGRSHGFFVRVRGRLVNLWDETFGIDVELSHGVLTRFRMVFDADGLDAHLASPRESIQDSPALDDARKYLLAVFNRARSARPTLDEETPIHLVTSSGRIADPPPALSEAPLRRMVRRALDGDQIVSETLGFSDDDRAEAQRLVTDHEPMLENVLIEPLAEDGRLIRYDPKRRAVVVNARHPFINNYLDRKHASEPLKLVGITELLTEAFMLDEEIAPRLVQRIVARRDNFLRALVQRHPRSASVISRALRDSTNREDDLEDAVADALELLGFAVTRISGNGRADGVAVAPLGMRDQGKGNESYSLTYDAKSGGGRVAAALQPPTERDLEERRSRGTAKKPHRIRASTAQTSILRVHREDESADFTLLVAPGFQGEDLDEALLQRVCRNDGITPMRVEDLARLVELFPFRAVSPLSLRPLFDCHTPDETQAFVSNLEKQERPDLPPIDLIVDVIFDYGDRKNPVTIEALNSAIFERSHRDIGLDDLTALVRGLEALAPACVYFDGKQVALNASREGLLGELRLSVDPMPDDIAAVYRSLLSVDR
jgi:hypothetical protein